ncbi:MAG: lipoprotein [Halomonas subglaciescola]|nr:lipoprotein [Halomonas subglaciescola]
MKGEKQARMTAGIKGGALLAGVLVAGLLAGCGQKGPLYPPDAESTAAEPIDAAEPTDAIEPAEAAAR